jgi:hypothetical protein
MMKDSRDDGELRLWKEEEWTPGHWKNSREPARLKRQWSLTLMSQS